MTSLPHCRPRSGLTQLAALSLALVTLAALTLSAQTGTPTSSQNQGTRPVGTSTPVPGTPTTLFAYGSTTTTDIAAPKDDDGSFSTSANAATTWAGKGPEGSSLTLSFLNNSYDGLFVNTNGNLSFDSGNTSFTSTNLTSFTGPALLAPFFADVDTRLGTTNQPSGNIWYRTTQNAAELASITARLSASTLAPQNFNPTFAQVVTWDKVGRYNQDNTNVSTFQAVLITDGSRTYTLFLYPENAIWWDNGVLPEYAGTFARIGYSAGNGVTGYEVAGSGTINARDLSITSNVGQPGTFVFDVGGTLTPRVVNGTLTLPATTGTAAHVLQLSANPAGHTITSTAAAGSILFNQLLFDNPANTVAFTDRVVALANAANAITAGNITFAGNAVLVARAANALNGGTLTLKDSAKLAIYAEGASTTATALTFNKTSGTGGTLDLRGFNAAIGTVNSTGTTSGVITNSGATAGTLTFGGTGTGNFNGVLQNGTNLLHIAKTGTGTQILSGTNTYTGTTTVSGGMLQFTNLSAFYNGTVTAATAAKLTAQTGGIAAFSIGGAGEFSTAQLTTLMGNANFIGGALGLDLTNFTGGTLTFTNTFGTAIGFAKLGTGSLVLSGSPYTGATALHGGDLAFTYSPTFSSLAGTGGVLTLGTGQSALIEQTATTRFAGGIAGSGPLIKNGTGSLTLAGTNTYTGTTTINAGTLQFAKTSAFYNGTIDSTTAAKLTVASGATAAFNVGGTGEFTSAHLSTLLGGNFASGSTLAFDTTTATGGRFAYTGTLAGAIGFSKIGSGTLALGSASTYSGNFTLSGGALELAHSAALQNSTVIFDNPGFSNNHVMPITGGSLSFGSLSAATVGGLSGAQWIPLANNSGGAVALTVGANDTSSTFSGNLAGSGSLNKIGTGTFTLSGVNTYTGNTTVNGGTLQFAKTSAFYNGTIDSTTTAKLSLAADATVAFNVGGTGEFTAANIATVIDRLTATANNGAILGLDTTNATGGAFTYAGALHLAHGLTKLGAGTLTLSSLHTYAGPTTVAAGTLKLSDSGSISPVTAVTVNAGATFQPSSTSHAIASLAGAGTVELALSNTLKIGGDNTSTVFSGTLQGTGSLTKVGNGTLTLAGENTAISNTTVSAGTLQIGDGGTTGSITGGISTAAGTTVAFNHSDDHDLYNAVSGAGAFLKFGTGTLTLLVANTNTGATTVSAGTLRLGWFDRLSDSAALTVSVGASFNLNGYTETVGSLAGAGIVTNSQATPSALIAGGNNESTTFSGTLSGNFIFGKRGEGTLTLTGNNTHTGGTTIEAGTLEIGAGGSTGAIAGNVVNQGDLIFNRSNALTFAGAISGSGYLIKDGAGTLTLTGVNTYTGGTIAFAGTLQIGDGGTTGSLASASITNNAALTFNRSDALTYAGSISGTGSLTKLGAGTLTLSGANSYTGATTISAGTLQIGAGGTTGSLANTALAIAAGATVRFDRSTASTFAGSLSGTGTLIKTGAGNVTFTGSAPSFQGPLLVNQGLLILATGGNAIGDSSPVTIASGASLSISGGDENFGSLAGSGSLFLANRTFGVSHTGTVEFSGTITDTGAVNKGGSGNWILSGANTYTGTTTLNLGTLTAGSTTAFGHGTVRVNAGTLNLANYAVSNALEVRGGALAGLANYAGTQTLSAAMIYAGTVGGSLIVASGGALNTTGATFTGATAVESGGRISGTGTTGPLTFASGSTLSPGNSPGILSSTGLTTLNGGTTYNWQLNRATGGIAGTNWDLLSVTGQLALNASSGTPIHLVLSTLDFTTGLAGVASNITPGTNYTFAFASATSGITGFSSATQFSLNTSALAGFGAGNWSVSQIGTDLNLTFTASAIPEPSTYAALLGAAAFALAAWRRRPKK